MLLAFAWRNLWRNPRRTWLTVAAVTLGTGGLVFAHSFGESSYEQMLEAATRGVLGQVQVHGRGYQANPDLATVVDDPDTIAARVVQALPGASSVARVVGFGLAGVGEKSAAASILGIDPVRERSTRLLDLRKGRALADQPAHEAVLGTGLARRLKAGEGSELVVVGQAADGSLANDRYTVVGIASTGSNELDEAGLFLHLRDAQDLFVLGRSAHLVVIGLPRGVEAKGAAGTLRSALPADRYEVLAWNELVPEVEAAIEADRGGSFAIDAIVFLIVVLGIFNTMTMSTFERIREFGILLSLGTAPVRVVAMVVAEALLLGAVSFVAGVALAALGVAAVGSFDMSLYGSSDFAGVSLPARVEISLNPRAVWFASITIFATSLLGGLFPAVRAARLQPADAVRHV